MSLWIDWDQLDSFILLEGSKFMTSQGGVPCCSLPQGHLP